MRRRAYFSNDTRLDIIKESKRDSIRQSVDIEGFYYYASLWHPCHIYDLSVGGAALKLNQSFIEGDKILLKFHSSDRDIIQSTVVNVDGQRIGIKFEANESIRKIIEPYLDPPYGSS